MSENSVLERMIQNNLEKLINEHKEAMKVWDVEENVSFLIGMYKLVLDADTANHEMSVKDTSFPYNDKQASLEKVIIKLSKAAGYLLHICKTFEQKGYTIKDKNKLESLRNAFDNTDKLFESFYASPEFEKIHEEAMKEYREGKCKDWPK